MELRVDPRSSVPPFAQLTRELLDAVASGELREGDRLPSVRSVASAALVNPNTVVKAIRELEQDGVVTTRVGSGVYVAEGGPQRARARRRAEVLRSLERALHEARRAGLGTAELEEVCERALRESEPVEPLEPSTPPPASPSPTQPLSPKSTP